MGRSVRGKEVVTVLLRSAKQYTNTKALLLFVWYSQEMCVKKKITPIFRFEFTYSLVLCLVGLVLYLGLNFDTFFLNCRIFFKHNLTVANCITKKKDSHLVNFQDMICQTDFSTPLYVSYFVKVLNMIAYERLCSTTLEFQDNNSLAILQEGHV